MALTAKGQPGGLATLDAAGQVVDAQAPGLANATASTVGVIQLAGDLAGTATAPAIAAGAVTSAKIADETIVDGDINASAAIAQSKVSGLTAALAGKVAVDGLFVDVRDHGGAPGGTASANTTALIASIAQANTLKIPVFLAGGTWALNTDQITLPTRISVWGAGRDVTILSWSGTGTAIGNPTPGTRIFDWNLSGFSMSTTTAAVAFDCDSLSTSVFRDIKASGFTDVGWWLHSTNTGGSVYNRFFNCTAQSIPTGYRLAANSSNANVWYGCRVNVCSVRGWDIQDSNDNTIHGCQAEVSGTAVYLTGSVAGSMGWNRIRDLRVEACTTGIDIASSNVSDTVIDGLWSDSSTTTVISDLGTRTHRASLLFTAATTNSIVGLPAGWQFVSGASVSLGSTSSSVSSASSAPLYLRGNVANGSTAVAAWIGSGTTLSTAGARVAGFCKDTPVTHASPVAYVNIDGSYEFASGVKSMEGTGTPEGAVTAPVGSTFQRRDGGAGTCFYVKESGAGNTGWVAK